MTCKVNQKRPLWMHSPKKVSKGLGVQACCSNKQIAWGCLPVWCIPLIWVTLPGQTVLAAARGLTEMMPSAAVWVEEVSEKADGRREQRLWREALGAHA